MNKCAGLSENFPKVKFKKLFVKKSRIIKSLSFLWVKFPETFHQIERTALGFFWKIKVFFCKVVAFFIKKSWKISKLVDFKMYQVFQYFPFLRETKWIFFNTWDISTWYKLWSFGVSSTKIGLVTTKKSWRQKKKKNHLCILYIS